MTSKPQSQPLAISSQSVTIPRAKILKHEHVPPVMSSLHIKDEEITWLRASILPKVEEDDLTNTYDFSHKLNERQELVRTRAQEPRGIEGAWWEWQLRFFDSSGTCILESGAPVVRKVAAQERLFHIQGRGTVVYNARIELAERFQRHQFATALYRAEQELYQRWGVREVHIHAVGAGALVWMKPPFCFLPQQPGFLRGRYIQWANKRVGRPPCPDHPALYPSAFLDDIREIQLFKVIT